MPVAPRGVGAISSVAGEGSAAKARRGESTPVAPRGVGAISSVAGEGGAASVGRARGESMPFAPCGVGAISSVLGEGGAASVGRSAGESTVGVCSCCTALGMVAMKSPSGEDSTASARRLKGESTSAVEARRRFRRRLAASTAGITAAGTTATAPLLVRVRVGPLAIQCSGNECVWIVGGATMVPVSHSSSESTAATAAIATAAASATPPLPPTAAETASVPSSRVPSSPRTAGP